MKIYLANESSQNLGGGWTFMRNLSKALADKVEFVNTWEACDVFFISGATMVTRELVEQAKKAGKKIVLRVDNIPRNSRNRNTGTSRLFDMAQMADEVIYQSEWCKDYLRPFLRRDGEIIINGCDQDIFKPKGVSEAKDADKVYMYSRYNRDETKHWEVAWYDYQMKWREDRNISLWIVGQFSPEQVEYNFDFYLGERYKFYGVVAEQERMAELYRGADVFMYTYYNDACSNTLVEVISCGMDVEYENETGGAKDIRVANANNDIDYFGLERMGEDYLKVIEGIK